MKAMKIVNVGNRIMNTWLYPAQDGWVMIDTGYANSYPSVRRKLQKIGIPPEEVRYLFLTHAHDDHAGFLEEWMTKHPYTKVIAHEAAVEGLGKGQNSFLGGCSTFAAYLFCQFMALLGNGDHRYPPLREDHLGQIITLNANNQFQLERALNGRILVTPGHTSDSISLLTEGNLFCGDAAMNGIPSSHRITIWVEDQAEYAKSWNTILASGAQKIYPAHGSPFCPCELARNQKFLEKIRLRPLEEKA